MACGAGVISIAAAAIWGQNLGNHDKVELLEYLFPLYVAVRLRNCRSSDLFVMLRFRALSKEVWRNAPVGLIFLQSIMGLIAQSRRVFTS